MVVQLLVVVRNDVAAGEHFFEVAREVGVNRHHIFEVTMFLAILDHQDLAVALDDLGFDLADFFVGQNFDGQLAIENLLADFGDTLRAQRVRGARPAQRRLGLLIGLEQGLVGPLGLGRRILLDPVGALEYRPRALGGDGHCFLHILYWLVHVLSLSTAWDYGKSGICHFSLGESSQPNSENG